MHRRRANFTRKGSERILDVFVAFGAPRGSSQHRLAHHVLMVLHLGHVGCNGADRIVAELGLALRVAAEVARFAHEAALVILAPRDELHALVAECGAPARVPDPLVGRGARQHALGRGEAARLAAIRDAVELGLVPAALIVVAGPAEQSGVGVFVCQGLVAFGVRPHVFTHAIDDFTSPLFVLIATLDEVAAAKIRVGFKPDRVLARPWRGGFVFLTEIEEDGSDLFPELISEFGHEFGVERVAEIVRVTFVLAGIAFFGWRGSIVAEGVNEGKEFSNCATKFSPD